MTRRSAVIFISLGIAAVVLLLADIHTGMLDLTWSQEWDALLGRGDPLTVRVVRDIRLVGAVVAMIVGIALAVSGLQMQTLFHNPLAGPYVLGITSGASLGVALLLLGAPLAGVSVAWITSWGMAGAAWAGAALVLAVVSLAASRLRDIMVILILGMMLSAGISAIVQLLQYLSHQEALKTFVVWTMGSLGDVPASRLWLLALPVAVGLLLGVAVVKPLNLLMLGEQYAVTMGVDLRRSRLLILISTTLLAGTVTAFCGPVGFVGLAVPHIARQLLAEADVRLLMPASALAGVVLMLACDIAARTLVIPINTVTALVGIPVVIWIVLKNKNVA